MANKHEKQTVNKKMMRCKSCGAQIAKSAKVCPNCGAKQHHGLMAVCVVIVVVVVFACVGIIVAANPGDKEVQSPTSSDTDSSSSAPAENVSEQETTDVKELVTLNGVKISFTGFAEPPYPAKGYYINLRIENTSDTDYTVQCGDLSVHDQMVPFGNYAFSAEVLAGKSLNTYIWVFNLDQLGIETPVTSAECMFYLIADMTTAERTAESDMIRIN